ncbi:MAG: hypothetical protein ACFE8N_04135 [Promethearchaeota archaeon]
MINFDKNGHNTGEVSEFAKAKGLIGILILDKAGSLFFSKVNKNRLRMAGNIFQIAGFISAIMIYSQDLIGGENQGLKLKDINLGNHHFYICTRKNLIFAYFIEKNRASENINICIQKIIEKFTDKYYFSHILNFKGDLSPFHEFETVVDQYFEI